MGDLVQCAAQRDGPRQRPRSSRCASRRSRSCAWCANSRTWRSRSCRSWRTGSNRPTTSCAPRWPRCKQLRENRRRSPRDVPVSRLDSFIRRLEAQRACLDPAAELIARSRRRRARARPRQRPHLRSSARSSSRIATSMSASATSQPIPIVFRRPNSCLLGDMRETLPAARARLAGRVALAHLDRRHRRRRGEQGACRPS